jgi:flagellar biosynthesis protein FlhG
MRNGAQKHSKSIANPLTVVSVTSGKGGVGKTMTTINLAITAAGLGQRVLVLDGDLGLANIDVVLGLNPKSNLADVIDGHTKLKDIILPGPMGIDLIPSGSGITRLTRMTYIEKLHFVDEVLSLEKDYDLLLIDTGAGISDTVLHLNAIADKNIVVTTSEPHSITDAYAMIKVLAEQFDRKKPHLLVNMCPSALEADRVYQRISDVAAQYLAFKPSYLGFIPVDPQVPKQVLMRKVGHSSSIHTLSGQAWQKIGREFFAIESRIERDQGMVWRELIWTQQYHQGQASIRG